MPKPEAGYRLTEKQKRFADAYLIDCNGTRAYLAVYTNVKKEETARANASRLLANANVKAYINERLEEMHSERTADAREVIEYLTSVMRGEQTEQTLRLVGDGYQKIDDIAVSARDRLKAAELLGKRYSLFTDKVQLDAVPVTIIDNIPKEEENAEA